jgi:hypothetical protein
MGDAAHRICGDWSDGIPPAQERDARRVTGRRAALSHQIDADGFALTRLRIDADLEGDRLAKSQLALGSCHQKQIAT